MGVQGTTEYWAVEDLQENGKSPDVTEKTTGVSERTGNGPDE